MPPKKKADGPSKKTEQKKKEKVIEDKTFGLKNKKGAKQQRFITQVEKQVKYGNQKASKAQAQMEAERNKKKEDKKKELDELNALFRPVAQTVNRGVDPKSVLCAFFKQGQCGKGEKCKFSHDLNINRKGEKRNLYEDVRADEDNMADWDEAKLEEVVKKKHGKESQNKTTIICKFFLEAVENSKYGWFWTCPNGGDSCMYRHALPPGFVLKKDQKKEEKKEKITIEELVEKERAALGHNTTKVTLETFLKWKERKRREKVAILEADQDKKKTDFKQGKLFGISGRQMFEFNPDLVNEDDDDAGDGVLIRENNEEEEVPVVDLDDGNVTAMAKEADGTGTQMTEEQQNARIQQIQKDAKNTVEEEEGKKLDIAGALPEENGGSGDKETSSTDAAIAAAVAATVNGEIADVPIDEDLFAGDDIDALDEDLDTLDLSD
ncbi:zinc finger CCCH domain-containing protein 15-like [Haliotis asinina]|uniref:zinc finger CCCH domain-containing protein 15-like n=1 Tax=Haliotis asinina TaxID=109174 RepID=UPI0035327658